jgi:hypothetical protein
MGSGGSLKYIGAPEKWLSLKDAPGLGDIEASDDSPPSNPMKEKMKRRHEAGKGKVSGVDATETIKRQTGDWGVWKYYGKSIGALPMLVALVFVLVSVFTSNFPSKSSSGPATRFNPAELWLQWNTGTTTPRVPLFIGIYFFVSTVSVLSMGGILLYLPFPLLDFKLMASANS